MLADETVAHRRINDERLSRREDDRMTKLTLSQLSSLLFRACDDLRGISSVSGTDR